MSIAVTHTRTFVGLRSVRPRIEPIRAVLLHWTGGNGGLERLFAVLRGTVGRKTPDGLSVHYGVDAAGFHEQWVPEDQVALHAGLANEWTVGFEVTCPGFPGKAWNVERNRGVVRSEYTDRLHGRRVAMLGYTEAQYAKLRVLVREVCTRHGLPFDYPREADGSLMRRCMTPAEWGSFRGVLGHYHVSPKRPGKGQKCDPGTEPFERLFK